jgi:diguanylate cyclase (GGDEF)-like protein
MAEGKDAPRKPTIRSRLMLLVIACIVPGALIEATLIVHDYRAARARQTEDALITSRALTSAVDRELAGVVGALQALATSPFLLAPQNLGGFHQQADMTLQTLKAANIVLVDRAGRQLMNTLIPFGAPLPPDGSPPQLLRMFESGQPVVTDLFTGALLRRPVIAVGLPIRHGPKAYGLAAGLFPDRLAEILARQRLPEGWICSIFDSEGTTVARTHEMQRFLGRTGAPALMRRIAQVNEDIVETDTVEGIPVYAAFSKSSASAWTVAIGIPRSQLASARLGPLWLVAVATFFLLAAGIGVAALISARIADDIRALIGPARALGSSAPVAIESLGLQEADEVARALEQASANLRSAQHRATHDPLTGLANRALLEEIAVQQLALCERNRSTLTLIYVDLDGFKGVNDAHGHLAGDDVLRTVAARLKSGIRASDVASRLGGDEFAALLIDTRREHAIEVAKKLVERLAEPYPVGAQKVSLSASVGIALSVPGGGYAALVERADAAMYQAKTQGKRRYALA